jgi:hypothetical protein
MMSHSTYTYESDLGKYMNMYTNCWILKRVDNFLIVIPSSWKVAGSRPCEADEFFQFTYSFLPHKALGCTHPLTEISITNRKIMFLGSRARPVRKVDNLTAICDTIV